MEKGAQPEHFFSLKWIDGGSIYFKMESFLAPDTPENKEANFRSLLPAQNNF